MENEITIEQCGYGQWNVYLTFTNIRYKYYCTNAELIDEFKNRNDNEEQKQKKAEKWLKCLCRLQGRKQIQISKWYGKEWKDEE